MPGIQAWDEPVDGQWKPSEEPMSDELTERLKEIANRDEAKTIQVRADDLRALLARLREAAPADAGEAVVTVINDAVEAATAAFNEACASVVMVACSRCKGEGAHHGFGEDDPDWCSRCGGGGYEAAPGEDTRPMQAALAAAYPELVAEIAALRDALKPFAVFAERIAKEHGGWDHDGFTFSGLPGLTLAPFRKARATLDAPKGDANE